MAALAPYQLIVLLVGLGFGLLFLVAGIFVLRGRGWDWIPGHKALPPEKRDSPKERRFCKGAGVFLVAVGLLDMVTMAAKLLGQVAAGDWGMRLLLALFLLCFMFNWRRLTQREKP